MLIGRRIFMMFLASIPITRADDGRTDALMSSPSRPVEVVRTVVFAAAPNGGNPCPVVHHAGLTDTEMQAVARYYGEDTVFLLPPTVSNADIQLRYFVPKHEMGISGHATVAAVTVALKSGVVQRTPVGIQTISGIFTGLL